MTDRDTSDGQGDEPKKPQPAHELYLSEPIAGLQEQYERDRQRYSLPLAETVLGPSGRMIWFSKSDFSRRFPERTPIWNANICTREAGKATKIWFGDLDLHEDEPPLWALARQLGKTVYVLFERDGRFAGCDEHPNVDRAVYAVTPSGEASINEACIRRSEDGRLHRVGWTPPAAPHPASPPAGVELAPSDDPQRGRPRRVRTSELDDPWQPPFEQLTRQQAFAYVDAEFRYVIEGDRGWFWSQPSPFLDGKTPAQLLDAGEYQRLWRWAVSLRSSDST